MQGGLTGQQRIRVLLDEIGSAGRHAEQVRRGGAQAGRRFRGMPLYSRRNGQQVMMVVCWRLVVQMMRARGGVIPGRDTSGARSIEGIKVQRRGSRIRRYLIRGGDAVAVAFHPRLTS